MRSARSRPVGLPSVVRVCRGAVKRIVALRRWTEPGHSDTTAPLPPAQISIGHKVRNTKAVLPHTFSESSVDGCLIAGGNARRTDGQGEWYKVRGEGEQQHIKSTSETVQLLASSERKAQDAGCMVGQI